MISISNVTCLFARLEFEIKLEAPHNQIPGVGDTDFRQFALPSCQGNI